MKKGNIKIEYRTKNTDNKNIIMKESFRIEKENNYFEILDFFFQFMERMGFNYYDFEAYIEDMKNELDKDLYNISLDENENMELVYDIPPVNQKVRSLIADNTFMSNIKYKIREDDKLNDSVITTYLNKYYTNNGENK